MRMCWCWADDYLGLCWACCVVGTQLLDRALGWRMEMFFEYRNSFGPPSPLSPFAFVLLHNFIKHHCRVEGQDTVCHSVIYCHWPSAPALSSSIALPSSKVGCPHSVARCPPLAGALWISKLVAP